MTTIPWKCPDCHQQHALVRLHAKSRSNLGVLCNANPDKPPVFVALPKSTQDNIDPADIAGIPEHYTPQAKKKVVESGNFQFAMPLVKEGETVERNVETMSEDDKKANGYLLEIEQLKQAQKEITTEIEKLARKRTSLENQEREVRAKLRVVYTEPLKLETP